jgi:integrase
MPIVLSIEQIAALLRVLKEPTRTMVFLAVFTGLRVGELLGLKWKDIEFQKMEIRVIRSIVMQHVGIARQKPLARRFLSICDCSGSCGTGDCSATLPRVQSVVQFAPKRERVWKRPKRRVL